MKNQVSRTASTMGEWVDYRKQKPDTAKYGLFDFIFEGTPDCKEVWMLCSASVLSFAEYEESNKLCYWRPAHQLPPRVAEWNTTSAFDQDVRATAAAIVTESIQRGVVTVDKDGKVNLSESTLLAIGGEEGLEP